MCVQDIIFYHRIYGFLCCIYCCFVILIPTCNGWLWRQAFVKCTQAILLFGIVDILNIFFRTLSDRTELENLKKKQKRGE